MVTAILYVLYRSVDAPAFSAVRGGIPGSIISWSLTVVSMSMQGVICSERADRSEGVPVESQQIEAMCMYRATEELRS